MLEGNESCWTTHEGNSSGGSAEGVQTFSELVGEVFCVPEKEWLEWQAVNGHAACPLCEI